MADICTACVVLLVILSTSKADYSVYNPATHRCCSGGVVDATMPDNDMCCGKTPYTYGEMACCHQKVVPLPSESSQKFHYYACCLNQATGSPKTYDYNTHNCCNGTVVEKPVKDGWYTCCGQQLYNQHSQICCNGTVTDKAADTTGCCANELYDEASQICCDGQLADRESGTGCCVNQLFNYYEQICCQEWSTMANEPQQLFQVFDIEASRTRCCGAELYNPVRELCCRNKILPIPDALLKESNLGCCDEQVYHPETHMCCERLELMEGRWSVAEAVVHRIVGNRRHCCGLIPFDYHAEVCCTDTIVPKPDEVHHDKWLSCCGTEPITDHDKQWCVNGILVDSSNYWVCGDKPYNNTDQFCCHDQLYEHTTDMECCWEAKRLYDTETELCCGKDIVRITAEDKASGNTACCSPDMFQYDHNA